MGLKTSLRKRYERSRALDIEGQTRECVEYLENPQILVAEFADSFLTAEAFDHRQEDFRVEGQALTPQRRWSDRLVRRLIQAEDITILEQTPYVFRYVAREIIPLWASSADGPEEASERRAAAGGLDYVGLIEGDEPIPVLGVVNPEEAPAPYLSLMRLLTCLAEVSPEAQMERANRFLFKGALEARPSFDLHILLVDWELPERPHPLIPLTRDLAHAFNVRLREEWEFPNLLRNIYCLRMSSRGFHGMLSIEWSA